MLKFAFSQIGLAGLVIGYVILGIENCSIFTSSFLVFLLFVQGSIIFMKIESSYEKITQGKVESNREDFYKDVRIAAEHIVNEYLRLNFHYKYNLYRNEETNGDLFMGEEVSNDIIKNSAFAKQVLGIGNESNEMTISKSKSTENNSTMMPIKTHNSTKINKYIKENSNLSNEKDSWHVKIDHEAFRKKIEYHLKIFLNEVDKIEDKDKATNLLREEVWTYSSSLLYSATVITTIGNFLFFFFLSFLTFVLISRLR